MAMGLGSARAMIDARAKMENCMITLLKIEDEFGRKRSVLVRCRPATS